MEFEELVETMRADEAAITRLFDSRERSPRSARSRIPNYETRFIEAARLVSDTINGRRGAHYLREALTTSDFPILFGDVLDRQVLGAYREWPVGWDNYININPNVPDFREIKRFSVSGADDGILERVGELAPYPAVTMDEATLGYKVHKYGRRIAFSWETLLNDDLQLLRDIPIRFGRAARRAEARFATALLFDSAGPDATFFSSGNANIVTSNAVLSITALQTAFTQLSAQRDEGGEPIMIEMAELVVPPALEVTAQNILNATQVQLRENGGTDNQRLTSANWMNRRVRLNVNPYIPIIVTTGNRGNTSWLLVANPNNGRPAAEVGFLRGHREPELFMREPDARRIGGGTDPMAGSFDNDFVSEYKLRHVFGGTTVDPKMAVGSNGSGS